MKPYIEKNDGVPDNNRYSEALEAAKETVEALNTPTTEHQLAKPATIWNGRNLIDIDCGAAYEEIDVWGIVIKTRLACLRLDDMKEFYSEEDLNEEGNQRR